MQFFCTFYFEKSFFTFLKINVATVNSGRITLSMLIIVLHVENLVGCRLK